MAVVQFVYILQSEWNKEGTGCANGELPCQTRVYNLLRNGTGSVNRCGEKACRRKYVFVKIYSSQLQPGCRLSVSAYDGSAR